MAVYWRFLLALLLVAVFVTGLAGQALAESPIDKEAREIAESLACPICQGQSVAESKSQLAQQMRSVIRKKVEEGESREEIMQYFVDRYGDVVLREPPKGGFNEILWWLPVLGLLAGAATSALVLHRWKTNRRESAPFDPAGIAGEQWDLYKTRLEKELGMGAWGPSETIENPNGGEEDDMGKHVPETGRGSSVRASRQESLSSSSSGKDPRNEQQTSAKSKARIDMGRANRIAGGGASRNRGWLLGIAIIAGLALFAGIASWSFLSKSETQAGNGVGSETRTTGSVTPQAQAARPIATLKTEDVHALAIGPRDDNVIYFGHHDGVLRSDDGGQTWRPLVAQRNFDAMGLAVSSAAPEIIYAAGHGILSRSTDSGKTWQAVANDLPGKDIHGFAMSAKDPKTLFAFVVGYGLFKSGDGGTSWKILSSALPASVMALAVSGDDSKTVYAGSMDSGLLRSTDGGVTWQPANIGLNTKAVMSLATSPTAPGLVYVGTDRGLFQSKDGGASWTLDGFNGTAMAVAAAPANPQLILLVDDKTNVYRSEDGGATWGSGR
ncbi:MAG: cytochrome c-type biogenesis protein CcmH [Dehalococcoidia bacterium]|nr:cytochrome c-type biogenesis protein CcmH [Dehalococcoidia bacterium]